MSDYKEKIKNREDSLKQTVSQVIGNQNAPKNALEVNKAIYDDAFLSNEISEHEHFRRVYKAENKNMLDNMEISAPKEYNVKEFTIQERKYGYFAKKRRIKDARSQKASWKSAISALKENVENERYGFELTDNVNEDTQDFMLSTKRLMAIENKKRELISSIISVDALKALKEKNEVTSSVFENYKSVILQLGPSIVTVPKPNESIADKIDFDEDSIRAYEAFLRFVVSDPIGAIKAAITDTLHSLTSFPEKMVEKKSMPQTFDRLMQIRDRYSAINALRVHRGIKGQVDAEKNPLGALMTELLPREDKRREKHEHDIEHDHDEKDNFDFIKKMEKVINSDLMTCLKNAGIKYKKDLLGTKKTKDYIDSDGNASKQFLDRVKQMISDRSDEENAEMKKLNAEHWTERENAAYDAVKDKQKVENDHYGIMRSIEKIKSDAEDKKNIKYNVDLANKLKDRIGKLNSAVIDLKFKADNCNKALELDQVKFSKDLKMRMQANADKAQYDLAILLERAKGYINAYDHTVSGRQLNEHGKSIMEEMKTTEGIDGFTVYEDKIDTRYSMDNIEMLNKIANAENKAQIEEIENDRDAIVKVKDLINDLDKDSERMIYRLNNITKNNKKSIINDAIDFKIRFLSATKYTEYKLSDNKTAINGLIMSLPQEQDRNKLISAYNYTIAKCRYISTYVDHYRYENILGSYTAEKLPKEMILSEEEKHFTKKDFKDQDKALKSLLYSYLNERSKYEKALGKNAIELNLADENPELDEVDENTIETLLAKVDLEIFSDKKNVANEPPVDQPVQDENPIQQVDHIENNEKNDDQDLKDLKEKDKETEDKEKEDKANEQDLLNKDVEKNEQHKENENERESNVQKDVQDNIVQEQAYQKRVNSQFALEIINEHSLDTTEKFVKFLNSQLGQINKINKTTWDELYKESKAWLVGSRLKHNGNDIDITDDNVNEILEQIHQSLINEGEIVDKSQYTDEDKARYNDQDIEEKNYNEGSVQRLIKDAVSLDSVNELNVFKNKKLKNDSQELSVQKQFKKSYSKKFKDEVAYEKKGDPATERNNIKIPEKDMSHVRWFIEKFPQNVKSYEDLSKFRNDWSRKIGYDMLQGKVIDINTYRKLKCIYDSIVASIDILKNNEERDKLFENLNKTDINKLIPDIKLENENKTIPNVHQWYSLSCWATSGALISNWYMKNKLKLENPPKIDQMTFLDPGNIVLNPYSEDKLQKEKLNANGESGMSAELANIKSFVMPKGQTGNIMSTADVMLSNMSNTAIRHLRFNIPLKDAYVDTDKLNGNQWNKITKSFFNKIASLMQNGSGPISLLIPGHYRTIIGFKDGKLRVRDSMLENGAVEEDLDVTEFTKKFKAGKRNNGYSLELVFLQNLNEVNKEQLKNDYGCEYDENGNLIYKEIDERTHAESPENMLHRLGISYAKKTKDVKDIIDRFTSDNLYVPKNLNHEQNVQNVNQKEQQLRTELKLPQINKDEIEQKARQFDEIAKSVREKEEEKWKNSAVKSQEELIEDEAKAAFKDKFTEKEKAELIRKTKVLKKQLQDNKKLKEKEKNVKPSALDVLYIDYEEKANKIDSVKSPEDKQKLENPLGFILSDNEMKTIRDLMDKNEVFVNRIVEVNESTVNDRNKAIEAIKKGDISLFNHLPAFLKEYFGRQKLNEFFGDNKHFKKGEIPKFSELSDEEKAKLAKSTRDPIFRSIINTMILRRVRDSKDSDAWIRLREYDAYMNQQLIMQTLEPMEEADKKRLKTEQRKLKKSKYDGRESAETMIANNTTKQRHLAKTMFLMQLGRFDMFETVKIGNNAKTTSTPYGQTVSEALGHGSRVGFSLPAGNKDVQQKLFKAWQGDAAGLMFGRFATHEFHRKKKGDNKNTFKEIRLKGLKFSFKKMFTNFHEERPSSRSDNYGLNIALGGLGKEFNKSVIDDQGKFAHIYNRYRMGDENTCGGMLVGIENSAPGGTCVSNLKQYFGGYNGTSCIGELHNAKAISHGQSAFFSSKENYGDQYGGRVIDLSNFDANNLITIIGKFNEKYSELQRLCMSKDKKTSDIAKNNLKTINRVLSGKILNADELYGLLRFCGCTKEEASSYIQEGRSKTGADYPMNKKYPDNMYSVSNKTFENDKKDTNKKKSNKKNDDFFEIYQPIKVEGEDQ